MSVPDAPTTELLRALCADGPDRLTDTIELTRQLHDVNGVLWALEDEARTIGDVHRLGLLKRRIDGYNARRAALVSAIDRTLGQLLPHGPPDVPPLASSLGASLDRLTVAARRAAVLAATDDERADDALQQMADLRVALHADHADLLAGRRRLPLAGVLKRYGATAPSSP
ncbi:DUF4254 domain-containing protein [Micromonospora okii]|uniref:DUF4254 domain-containing protein n=1 Tax=Micromonospora okii TaxID=1182970 RepID=UPI001E55A09C|nr:DUF4254 domain-containing protein [Micromonospora okii]